MITGTTKDETLNNKILTNVKKRSLVALGLHLFLALPSSKMVDSKTASTASISTSTSISTITHDKLIGLDTKINDLQQASKTLAEDIHNMDIGIQYQTQCIKQLLQQHMKMQYKGMHFPTPSPTFPNPIVPPCHLPTSQAPNTTIPPPLQSHAISPNQHT
eukprot:10430015-Ditylum_brightwellii.AAC.1